MDQFLPFISTFQKWRVSPFVMKPFQHYKLTPGVFWTRRVITGNRLNATHNHFSHSQVANHNGAPVNPDHRDRLSEDDSWIEESVTNGVKSTFPGLQTPPAIIEACMYTVGAMRFASQVQGAMRTLLSGTFGNGGPRRSCFSFVREVKQGGGG